MSGPKRKIVRNIRYNYFRSVTFLKTSIVQVRLRFGGGAKPQNNFKEVCSNNDTAGKKGQGQVTQAKIIK